MYNLKYSYIPDITSLKINLSKLGAFNILVVKE